MYNVQKGYFLVEIPKSGSRSLVQAVYDHHGKQYMKAHGHETLAHFLDVLAPMLIDPKRQPKSPLTVYAFVREPLDRLISAVNHRARVKAHTTLDDVMTAAVEQSDIVFKPQYKFLEAPTSGEWELDLQTWKLENINSALEHIVGRPVSYHRNAAPRYYYGREQITRHPLYEEAMRHFEPDNELWEKSR